VRRYHFHIRCGDRVLFDGTGRLLPGLTEAAREAERIARALMHRDQTILANVDEWRLDVREPDDVMLFTLPFSEVHSEQFEDLCDLKSCPRLRPCGALPRVRRRESTPWRAALRDRSPRRLTRLDHSHSFESPLLGRQGNYEQTRWRSGRSTPCFRRARIEHVDGRSRLSQSKKDIYKAKGQGFDVKILREVIRIRKKDQKERDEEESLLDVYLQALATAPPPIAKAA